MTQVLFFILLARIHTSLLYLSQSSALLLRTFFWCILLQTIVFILSIQPFEPFTAIKKTFFSTTLQEKGERLQMM